MKCPRCGHENNEGDRFCANCGNRLTPVAPPRENVTEPAPAPEPEKPRDDVYRSPFEQEPGPSSIPPPVTPTFSSGNRAPGGGTEDTDDEWKMSSLGPPPRRKRRVWLWIIVAILAVFLIACCSFLFFVTATDTGQDWFSDFATQVVEEATQQAE
jgi:hypothetical protein